MKYCSDGTKRMSNFEFSVKFLRHELLSGEMPKYDDSDVFFSPKLSGGGL